MSTPVVPLPVSGTPLASTASTPSGPELHARAAEQRRLQEAAVAEIAQLPLRRSDSIGALAGALAKAQGQIGAASRDSDNPYFKSRYASLAAVLDACRAALSANELAYLQPVTSRGRTVIITTLLAHSSGEWIEERLILTAQQDTPQAVGSAMTFGRRYGLAAMVGVAPADDDGEAATHSLPPGVKWDKGGRSGRHQTIQGVSDEIADGQEEGVPTGIADAEPVVATDAPPPPPPVIRPPVARPVVSAPRPTAGVVRPAAGGATPPPPGGRPPMKAPTA